MLIENFRFNKLSNKKVILELVLLVEKKRAYDREYLYSDIFNLLKDTFTRFGYNTTDMRVVWNTSNTEPGDDEITLILNGIVDNLLTN
ncbi:hypothetical protein [Paenibacillus periandrae]|uniref:hypothetical protein n=1 Tax=Paenibacillus periandrae TaxID=1761741 RepID=UPI001F094A3B|nr:hypothetical protein [Paenibacillus periandrae]